MSTKETIRAFITKNFYVEAGTFTDQTSLIEQGIVDSTGMLEVTGFLEKEFGITVQDDEIVPENMETVDNLAAFVAKKSERAA